jgi:hypothetical protein
MGTAQSSESEADDNGIVQSAISQSYFSDDDDDRSAYQSDPELSSSMTAGNTIFRFFRHRRRARHEDDGSSGGGGSHGLHGGPSPIGNGPGGGGGGGVGGRGHGHGSTKRRGVGRRSTTHHTDMLSNGNVQMALELQLKDSWVSCFRGMVILVLLTATTLLVILSYRVDKVDQNENFERRFHDLAVDVMEVTRENTEHSLHALESLSTTMTNWAIGTNATWPFVTFPEFETQVAQVMKESHPSIVAMVPLVAQDQRTQWEGYTHWNQGWVQQGLMYQKEEQEQDDGNDSTAMETAQPASPFIYHLLESSLDDGGVDANGDEDLEFVVADQDPKDGFYAPVWQYAPVQAEPLVVNLDVLEYSYFRRIHQLLEYTTTTTTTTTANSNNNEHSSFSSVLAEIIEPGHQAGLLDLSAKVQATKKKENQDQVSLHTGLEDPPIDFDTVQTWPQSFMAAPIFDSHHAPTKKVVAMLVGLEPVHGTISHHLVPEGSTGLVLVIQNTCHASVTYEIDHGPTVVFLGHGDLHDPKYSRYEETSWDTGFPIMTKEGDSATDCIYSFHVYPSANFEVAYHSRQPIQSTGVIIGVFVVTAIFFFLYDCFVERRQALVLSTARRSNQIVNSLFPANVRDRLVNHNNNRNAAGNGGAQRLPNPEQAQPTVQAVTELVTGMPKAVLHAARNPSVLIPDLRTIPNRLSAAAPFITGGALSSTPPHPHSHRRGSREWKVNNSNNNNNNNNNGTANNGGGDDNMFSASRSGKPIADFFPFVSVMFSDIVGFTAWSSVREPFQVFTLLESVYNAFDRIAKKLRIFKVETIGDCYVAAAGLPDPRDDHAVVMARFARACLAKMSRIVHKLERELGYVCSCSCSCV